VLILEAFFFAIPLYVSNSFASLSMSIPKLKDWSTPIDLGKSINNKRILGDGKTFRGLTFGTFCAIIAGFLQYLFVKKSCINFEYLISFNNASLAFFLITSFLLGFGALVGDSIKSLIKRRVGIKRGRPWPPFDQLDFLVGSILFVSIYYFPGWKIILVLLIATPILHLLSNITAYLLNLKEVWW